MDKIIDLPDVEAYDRHWGVATRHPLINIMPGSRIEGMIPNCRKNVGMYVVFLKDIMCADYITYGRQEYDFQENTLLFIGPGQVFGHPADGSVYKPKGWVLYFSPELLHGTSLGRHIKDYTFFSYASNEALHLSQRERDTVIDCFRKIDEEIDSGGDRHSTTIIASALELFLNYCLRFYDRQFSTREKANKDILIRFEEILDSYFTSGKAASLGTPTVAWSAGELNLSPNYFGDLIKKETGRSARDYIQQKITDTAKEMLHDCRMSVSEIAYALGYQYPQYFSRAFKNSAGVSPNEYRREISSRRQGAPVSSI